LKSRTEGAPRPLDRIDRRILRTLQDDGRISITDLAERVGLFSALIRGSLRDAPRAILTPLVCIIGMMSHHASDAAYVVFIPLAALLYAAVGRHPLVGLAAAFAAVSGGYAGNLFPGAQDALLLEELMEGKAGHRFHGTEQIVVKWRK
jgi:p-aminobenzoyl-glutamate transporter AbgT